MPQAWLDQAKPNISYVYKNRDLYMIQVEIHYAT